MFSFHIPQEIVIVNIRKKCMNIIWLVEFVSLRVRKGKAYEGMIMVFPKNKTN